MGKSPFSFRRRTKKRAGPPPSPPRMLEITSSPSDNRLTGSTAAKAKKKTGGARLWMRFDRFGKSELVEWEKNTIIRHAGIPARDLRILGPIFSHSSSILGNSMSLLVCKILGFLVKYMIESLVINFLKFCCFCCCV